MTLYEKIKNQEGTKVIINISKLNKQEVLKEA